MRDKSTSELSFSPSGAWVDAVANRALAVVAERSATGRKHADPELLSMMRDCLLGGDRDACRLTVRAMTDAGVTPEDIADLYIPGLAHQLGEDWCDDKISFAEVTIGTSKLQALLRELGLDWRADGASAVDSAAALVLVGADEYHTLGAQLLAGRLRREGLSVKIKLSANRADVAEAARSANFDIIMISAARGETLESVRILVETVRKAAKKPPPIVVGGGIGGQGLDIEAVTGADFATSNIDEALRLCGLSKKIQNHEHQKRRS